MRWQDVDLGSTPATVSINGTATHVGGLHRQDCPKTPASKRTLELPASVTGALLSRQVESGSGSEYVFASSTGTIRSPHNLRRALRSFIERHPEWEWITPKTGRKTCLTWIRDRYGIEMASWQADHADSSVAGRHYVGHRGRGPTVAEFFEEVLTGVSDPALSKENVK